MPRGKRIRLVRKSNDDEAPSSPSPYVRAMSRDDEEASKAAYVMPFKLPDGTSIGLRRTVKMEPGEKSSYIVVKMTLTVPHHIMPTYQPVLIHNRMDPHEAAAIEVAIRGYRGTPDECCAHLRFFRNHMTLPEASIVQRRAFRGLGARLLRSSLHYIAAQLFDGKRVDQLRLHITVTPANSREFVSLAEEDEEDARLMLYYQCIGFKCRFGEFSTTVDELARSIAVYLGEGNLGAATGPTVSQYCFP